MRDRVDVLLATYQGAPHLRDQLRSLMAQTYPLFHVWIRDDASSDATLDIIGTFLRTYPERFSLLPSQHRLGIKGNFSALMSEGTAPYTMFCDQDDVWLPHKIEASLRLMKACERREGKYTPLLLHTDLQIVNAGLKPIAPSFWHYAHLCPQASCLNALLKQNVVTGCTTMINRPLLQLAHPIPDECVMHDWWLALVAALFGKIEFLPEASMLYRQHGRNALGAKKFHLWQALKRKIKKHLPLITRPQYRQAKCLQSRYLHRLDEAQKKTLHDFFSRNLKF